MLHIGCHLSSSKGFAAMGRQALELGADTFQFFTRNPRGSKAKDLDSADAAALVALMEEHHFAPIILLDMVSDSLLFFAIFSGLFLQKPGGA